MLNRKAERRKIKMKKLMKKKMNVFGKSFSVFAIAMVAVIGLGAAALVPYLSNTVSGEVTIDSPLTITGLNTLNGSFYGGDTLNDTLTLANNANNPITTSSEIVITAESDFTENLDEFTELVLIDGENEWDLLTSDCERDSSNSRIVNCDLGDMTLAVGDSKDLGVRATLNPAIKPEKYTFSARAVVPN